jgi:hypothetical protein
MRYTIAALAACFALSANAEDTFSFDNGTVAIQLLPAQPCANPVLAQMLVDAVPGNPSFAATVTYQGRKIGACWVLLPPGFDQIGVLDEDGDSGTIPVNAFKRHE